MPTIDDGIPSTNGALPSSSDSAGPSLDPLRATPANVHLLRGYGPLVVGFILFVLMVTLAPTVAPERVVERPVDAPAEASP